MAHTDPSPTTQISDEGTSGDQSAQLLDPPTLPFAPTPSNVARPSTARTSVTQVDHDDDAQPTLSLAPEPTSLDIPSSASHQAPEPISTLSQDKQQSVQQASIPFTQTQTTSETVPQTPQTYLTFLLISGRRRTMSFEPDSPIGRVKELAWNSWPTGQCSPTSTYSLFDGDHLLTIVPMFDIRMARRTSACSVLPAGPVPRQNAAGR